MISSATRTFAQFLLVATFFLLNCEAGLNQPKCLRFYSNNTHQLTNEIDIKVGDSLAVDCVSNDENISKNGLFWSANMFNISSDMTTKFNSTLLRLNLKNASTSQTGHYKCSSSQRGICFTRIRVGYPPIPVVDFSCTDYNFEYMECSWTAPPNPVTVKYYLNFVHYRTLTEIISSVNLPLPRKPFNTNFYNLTSSSPYPYNKFRQTYDFALIGNNSLGQSMWNFTINHFARVLPGQLTDLNVVNIDDTKTVNISYRLTGSMMYYTPGVLYRLRVNSQWGDSVEMFVNETSTVLSNLLPYTNYSVHASCVARMANKEDQSMWSRPAVKYFRTLADVPEVPPEIVNGSFRVQSYINHTDITLYWKAVPDKLKNGKRLSYFITAKSLNTNVELAATTDQGFITFSNLSQSGSYMFNLYSRNEAGTSNRSSVIVVSSTNSLISRPKSITVTAYSPFLHNIKWLSPTNVSHVTGYRIFWIESDSKFQVNPKGFLFWKDVGSNVTKENITVSGKWPYHHFGVSAIGANSASGIIWNTCIVLFNGTIGRMKYVDVFANSENVLTVNWNIDCAEKLGVVTGFNVYYCIVNGPVDDICKDGSHRVEFENDDNAVSHVLSGLRPYTWYKMTVSVVTEAGEGEQSKPLIAQTLESVPEAAVSSLDLLEATNNSFVVKWRPPNATNGIIAHYEIHYMTETQSFVSVYKPMERISSPDTTFWYNVTDKVEPYVNYSVALKACTKVGCSNSSMKKSILTDVGVPLQMDPPQVRLVNLTYAVVQLERNHAFNGPSPTWDIKTVIVTQDNHTFEEIYSNLTEDLAYVRFNCEDEQLNSDKMEVRTRAANFKNTEALIGEWSDYAKLNCVTSTFSVGIVIAITFAAVIGLVIVILMLFVVTRKLQIIIHKCQGVKVALPDGLSPVDYKEFVAGHKPPLRANTYTKADQMNGTDRMLLDEESRSRNISGDTTQSSGSTEELLMQHKGKWGNDSINSGNHDSSSTSSRPSTTQTQLSSESSLEMVPSGPDSPDSVFNDHPLKVANGISTIAQSVGNGVNGVIVPSNSTNGFNPTLTPIGETQDGNLSHSGTPQHYSKFAGYYDPSGEAASPKRSRGIHNGYVAPYSKFGIGLMGGASNLGGGLVQPDLPSDRFSLEINDNDPSIMSYSKVGLSIPLFPEQQPNGVHKAASSASSPLTSTPTHTVTGYSVLGLSQANPIYDPLGNSGPFSQSLPVAVSSPIEGTSKGYVLAATMNNHVQPQSELTSIPTQDDCEHSLPKEVEGVNSPNLMNLNAHKRSPSNTSSLTAGYCRLALSRPNSTCSETDQNYVRADQQSAGMVGSPVLTTCRNSDINLVSSAGSPHGGSGGGGNNIGCNSLNSGVVNTITPTVLGSSGPSGYATMQQLLKEKGNS